MAYNVRFKKYTLGNDEIRLAFPSPDLSVVRTLKSPFSLAILRCEL
jgi:hypothetical protein